MASFVYTQELAAILSSRFISNGALDDNRVLLVMSNTTADTEEDEEFVDDITTLDEFDGANYVRKALASEDVSADEAADEGVFDAADLVAGGTGWSALGAGARDIVAIVHYHHVSDDTDSPLTMYDDSAAQLPFNGNGGDVGITWDSDGILRLGNAS